MSKSRRYIYLIAAIMLLGSLACNTITGGGQVNIDATAEVELPEDSGNTPATEAPEQPDEIPSPTPLAEATEAPVDEQESEFPMPDDASTVTVLGEGQVNFTTGMAMSDIPDYYREEFTALGYTERTLLTVISDQAISMVFDGHASGKAIVMQAVDLGGSTNVNIRLEAIP